MLNFPPALTAAANDFDVEGTFVLLQHVRTITTRQRSQTLFAQSIKLTAAKKLLHCHYHHVGNGHEHLAREHGPAVTFCSQPSWRVTADRTRLYDQGT